MNNVNIVAELGREFSASDSVEILLKINGVDEISYHSGWWNGYPLTCVSTTNWQISEVMVSSYNVAELIDLLSSKEVSDISSLDLRNPGLSKSENGHIEVGSIIWTEEQPSDEELQTLITSSLYDDLQVDDTEISFLPGGIYEVEITISQKHKLIIDASGSYYFQYAPRVNWWSEEDKKVFEQRYISALRELKSLQAQYNLLLDSGEEENLPYIEYDEEWSVTFGNSKTSCSIALSRDRLEKEVVELQFLTEHGSIFSYQLDDLKTLIKLRNHLMVEVDKFGRGYFQKLDVDESWTDDLESL